MGVATERERWWNDVLENGPASHFADYFDIAWHASARDELRDRVLLPVLANPTARRWNPANSGSASTTGLSPLHYYDRRFPVEPAELRPHPRPPSTGAGWPSSGQRFARHSPNTRASSRPSATCRIAPRPTRPASPSAFARRKSSSGGWRNSSASSERVRRFIDETVARFNGTPGDPHSFDLLDDLLAPPVLPARRTGAWPPTRSTIAVSSTSMNSPR